MKQGFGYNNAPSVLSINQKVDNRYPKKYKNAQAIPLPDFFRLYKIANPTLALQQEGEDGTQAEEGTSSDLEGRTSSR